MTTSPRAGLPSPLQIRVRTESRVGTSIDQPNTTLSRSNTKATNEPLEDSLDISSQTALVVPGRERPHPAVDVAGMHAVDGDVAVLVVGQEAVLDLGYPALVVEFVAVVVVASFCYGAFCEVIHVVGVEDASEVNAGGCADDSGLRDLGQRVQETVCQENVGKKVDLDVLLKS